MKFLKKKLIAHSNFDLYIVILLVIIICFFSINLWLWIGFKDYFITSSDIDKHMGFACEAAEYLFSGSKEQYLKLYYWVYPPLYYIPAIILIRTIQHVSEGIILLSLAAYFPLIAIASYKLGKLVDSPAGGITLAILSCAFFFMTILQDGYTPDNALSGWILAGLYLLAATKGFKNKRYSCLFGICFGFGLLSKWSYPIFLFFPFIISSLSLMGKHKFKKIINIILAGACALMTICPWYFQHFNQIITYLTHSAGINNSTYHSYIIAPMQILPAISGHKPLILSLSPDNLPTNDITLIIVLLLSSAICLLHAKQFPAGVFPFTSVLGAFILVSLSQSPEQRYLRPCIPLFFVSALAALRYFPLNARRIIYAISCFMAIMLTLSWTGIPSFFKLNADIASCNPAALNFKDPMGALTDFKKTSGESLTEDIAAELVTCSLFLADRNTIFINKLVSTYYLNYLLRNSPLTKASKWPNPLLTDLMFKGMSNQNIYNLQQSLPKSILIDINEQTEYEHNHIMEHETPLNKKYTFIDSSMLVKYYYLKTICNHRLQKSKLIMITHDKDGNCASKDNKNNNNFILISQ